MSANNGGNPRLDRIERMLEGLTRKMAESREEFDRALAKSREEFDRKIAESEARAKRDSRRFRDDLRRWAALGVKEARKQRKNHREIEIYLTRLAAAQLVTEERLDGLIASLQSGRNGGGRKSV